MIVKPTAAMTKKDLARHERRLEIETSPRRVRVQFNGETIAESDRMLLVHETGHLPVYYFPRAHVRMEFIEPTAHRSRCPPKGEASYWRVRVGDRVAENAVWAYENPTPQAAGLKDHMAVYWDAMDHWYEEDEEVFVHARDPYTRVDVVASKRNLRVELGGEAVVRTNRALFLYETGLPTRYYLPAQDVRMDLLEPSETRTRCPYKGEASYWSARIGGQFYDDIAWCYREPVAECPRIAGYLSFFNERVDRILIEGKEIPRPRTKWSRE